MRRIVGYVGTRDATAVILDSLKRLQNRRYDSSGQAIVRKNGVDRRINLTMSVTSEWLALTFQPSSSCIVRAHVHTRTWCLLSKRSVVCTVSGCVTGVDGIWQMVHQLKAASHRPDSSLHCQPSFPGNAWLSLQRSGRGSESA